MHEKIVEAMYCLAAGDKPLLERVADAHRFLLRTSCHDGFEQEFKAIEGCLAGAEEGDYSKVTKGDVAAFVDTVMQMYRKLP